MQISSTERNTSFTNTIDGLISRDTQHVPEKAWVHFLQDHYVLLLQHSVYVVLDEKALLRYQYRISDYLRDTGLTLGADQAFRVVNRLHSDLDFNMSITGVYLPSEDYVDELRKLYATNKRLVAMLDE